MSTVIRPEISKKSQYYISRHRYYELKHFCMQYKEFKKAYNSLCEKIPGGVVQVNKTDGALKEDESFYVRERYLNNINLIEECAKLTDSTIGAYILKAVTEGLTYSSLRLNDSIPCCKDSYYELYRKFFYILSRKKQTFL